MSQEPTSLLINVLFATQCRSTHHKLALDALRHLRGADAESWQHLFLRQADAYLDGSKAPDDDFKDFKNHVLHVHQNNWGGAVAASRKWYDATVSALRERKWPEAAYNAGVLSHYVTDPVMPLHTGQTEEENTIHRAVEWSVTKSYEALRANLLDEQGGYPARELPAGADWLAAVVLGVAREAHAHYQAILDHYDFARGVKNPPAGLDAELRSRFARLLGLACVTFARVLERALEESQSSPAPQPVTLAELLAKPNAPLNLLMKRLTDHQDRAIVEATYQELRATGRVVESLPDELKSIRSLHAREVLRVSESELTHNPLRPTGTRHGKSVVDRTAINPAACASISGVPSARFFLDTQQPVVDAPAIGPKTAARLNQADIHTVADLLDADALRLAERLKQRAGGRKSPNAETIRDWQAQATLASRIPNLRGHDAQILVACGITNPEQLAASNSQTLWCSVAAFLQEPAAPRILRDGRKPDAAEIQEWIEWARQARPRRAA